MTRFGRKKAESGAMAVQKALDEATYRDAEVCLAAIAQRVAQGWAVSAVRVAAGQYRVVFLKKDDEA